MADKIQPLPVSDPNAGKLVPFNGSEPTAKPAGVSASPANDTSDPVDSWITDNPTFQGADPTETTRETRDKLDSTLGTAPEATDTPATETPSETADAAPVGATAKPATDAKPSDEKPVVAAPVAATEAPTKPTEPIAPAAKSYDPNERLALADGVEWTRAQVTKRLEQYVEQQPLVQEAAGFRQLFGADFASTKQAWEPILQRLVAEPHTSRFIDEFLANPDLAGYLDRCRVNYYVETGSQPNAAPTQPQQAAPQPNYAQPQPGVDPAMARQLKELSDWKAAQERQVNEDRVNREIATATQRYPMLASDKALLSDLLLTARYMNAQDPSKGILDALAAKSSIYDALAIARTTPPAMEAAPAPAPALLGTGGASPTASRQTTHEKPRKFDDLNDAVDEFISNPPKF